MNKNGPRTEPWGTPSWTTVVEDVNPLYLMYCLLPTRYERIQSSTAPPNPNDTSSRPRRMLWSTQSKAALRSSIPSRVSLPMSAAIRASEVTFKRAVSVEWLRRYAIDVPEGDRSNEDEEASARWQPVRASSIWTAGSRWACNCWARTDQG